MKQIPKPDIEYSKQHNATRWRLIIDGAASGEWNMAVDEALLCVAGEVNRATPILRFYAWQPSCLSLGRFQRAENLSLGDLS